MKLTPILLLLIAAAAEATNVAELRKVRRGLGSYGRGGDNGRGTYTAINENSKQSFVLNMSLLYSIISDHGVRNPDPTPTTTIPSMGLTDETDESLSTNNEESKTKGCLVIAAALIAVIAAVASYYLCFCKKEPSSQTIVPAKRDTLEEMTTTSDAPSSVTTE